MIPRIDGEKLKRARKNAGMTQPELARMFKMSIGAIVNWERQLANPNEAIRPAVIKFIEEWSE